MGVNHIIYPHFMWGLYSCEADTSEGVIPWQFPAYHPTDTRAPFCQTVPSPAGPLNGLLWKQLICCHLLSKMWCRPPFTIPSTCPAKGDRHLGPETYCNIFCNRLKANKPLWDFCSFCHASNSMMLYIRYLMSIINPSVCCRKSPITVKCRCNAVHYGMIFHTSVTEAEYTSEI